MPRGAPLPGRDELLIRGVTVLTMDQAVPDLAAGDVHVREGTIVAVAPMIQAPAAQVIDGAGMICIPGFVDTHFHLWTHKLGQLGSQNPVIFGRQMGQNRREGALAVA